MSDRVNPSVVAHREDHSAAHRARWLPGLGPSAAHMGTAILAIVRRSQGWSLGCGLGLARPGRRLAGHRPVRRAAATGHPGSCPWPGSTGRRRRVCEHQGRRWRYVTKSHPADPGGPPCRAVRGASHFACTGSREAEISERESLNGYCGFHRAQRDKCDLQRREAGPFQTALLSLVRREHHRLWHQLRRIRARLRNFFLASRARCGRGLSDFLRPLRPYLNSGEARVRANNDS